MLEFLKAVDGLMIGNHLILDAIAHNDSIGHDSPFVGDCKARGLVGPDLTLTDLGQQVLRYLDDTFGKCH